jgi:hypothetical protein
MTRQLIALAVCAALVSGCATAGGARPALARQSQAAGAPATPPAPTVLAEYVQKLPLGTKVRVDRTSGGPIKGTLMKASDTVVVVQPRTRVPEPPIEIPLADVLAVTPEGSNGVAKAIGIGAAAGAAAALGTILILIAAFSD